MAYRYVLFLGMMTALGACKGREHYDPLALPSAAEPEKAKKPLSELFSAKAPAYPAVFRGAKPGMPADEASKMIPGIDKDYRVELADYKTSASLYVDSDDKKVRSLDFFAGKEGVSLATAAWGKPIVVKDIGGRDLHYWFNPTDHVRAKVDVMMDMASVHLDSYLPFAEFLGSDKAAFGFEKGKSLVGQSVDDIRKNYAAYVLEKTAAENKAMNDKVQAFAGRKLDMGAAEASLNLSYPPSEWEGIPKTVSLHFEKGKVTYYMFDISYDDYPPVKDEILALLKKTYGEPKTVKDLGDTYLVFRKSPTVKVKDETITKAWSFTVEK